MGNILLVMLEPVVQARPEIVVRIPDDAHHVLCRLPLAEVQHEPVPEPLDCRLALEARQARAEHEVDRVDELVGVRPDGQERLDCELVEQLEPLRVGSAHERDHLAVELERVGLEFDTAGANVEEEAKVCLLAVATTVGDRSHWRNRRTNVDDMPVIVNHDVTIVPVLDLQDEAGHRVRRHGPDKVEASLLVCCRLFATILLYAVQIEVVDVVATHLVSGCRVRHDINDTALLFSM